MDQPTAEQFEHLQKRVEKLEQQQTEPIKITRIEIEQGGLQAHLGSVQQDTAVIKIQMQGARADLLNIRESQADQRDTLKEHGQRLESIEQKQDAHSELLGQLINIGEETKTTQAEHSKRFDKLEAIMMQILERLPKSEDPKSAY